MFFLYLNGHLHFFMWNSALYSLSCFYWIISLSLSFRFTKAFYKINNLGHFLSYMLEIFLKFIICTFHGIFPSTLNTFYDICLNDKKRTSPHQNYKKISLKKKDPVSEWTESRLPELKICSPVKRTIKWAWPFCSHCDTSAWCQVGSQQSALAGLPLALWVTT